MTLHGSNEIEVWIVRVCYQFKPLFIIVFHHCLDIPNGRIHLLDVVACQDLVKVAETVRADIDALILRVMAQ